MSNSKLAKESRAWHNYHRAAAIALASVFLVILAGAVVRTTGSGMGCPDWPKCFGQWLPPTDVSQLPADYQTRYDLHGHGVAQFNAAKTWTEYVNRLIGAVAGLMVAWMVVQAFFLRKLARWPLVLSLLCLFMMGFQAWLGKKVVDMNLKENMITLHMVVAVLIVFVLLLALQRRLTAPAQLESLSPLVPNWMPGLQTLVVLLSLFQLALGTQVREQVDAISTEMNYSNRAQWVEHLGVSFYVHRSFSLVLLALGGWVAYLLIRMRSRAFWCFAVSKLALLGIMILSGIFLAYLDFPAWAQPVHLLFSIVLLALEFVIMLNLRVLLHRRMPLWGAKIVAS